LEENLNTKEFSLSVFALKSASKINAVSKIHQKVSKKLWSKIWNKKNLSDIPIDYITNGVHHTSWVAFEFSELFRKYIHPKWQDRIEDKKLWQKIYSVPDEEILQAHFALKQKLVEYIKQKVFELYAGKNIKEVYLNKILNSINSEKLIIGFARRFASYKRATLIFENEMRLAKILKSYPVLIVFSGKSFPTDPFGLELVKKIYKYSLDKKFLGKVIFIEDYGILTAKYLTQGCDVWLNNPKRPLEASGTSGQKAAMNGVLNFSVLDGWFPEFYNGKNGWAIFSAKENLDPKTQNKIESENLYDVLENKIIPLYFSKKKIWVKMMKESIATIMPTFNTHRMVKEYYEKLYKPLLK
jgi:starch phosphorylase